MSNWFASRGLRRALPELADQGPFAISLEIICWSLNVKLTVLFGRISSIRGRLITLPNAVRINWFSAISKLKFSVGSTSVYESPSEIGVTAVKPVGPVVVLKPEPVWSTFTTCRPRLPNTKTSPISVSISSLA